MHIQIDMYAISLIINLDLAMIFFLNFSYQMIQSEKKTFKIFLNSGIE